VRFRRDARTSARSEEIKVKGTLDPSFNGTGIVDIPFLQPGEFASWNIGASVAVQNDGGIIAAGFSGGLFVPSDFILARYDGGGALDPAFGSGGFTSTNFGSQDFDSNDLANAVMVQDDRNIVLAGRTSAQNIQDYALARYEPTGVLDVTFGNGGKTITNFGGPLNISEARGVALQKDGRIVAAGYAYVPNQPIRQFAVARYNRDGQLDQNFGNAGLVTFQFQPGFDSECYGVAIQSNGRILVAGTAHFGSHTRFALAGLVPSDGSLDPGFGSGGLVTTDFPSSSSGYGIALGPGGLVAVGGSTTVGNIERTAVAVYEPDGSLFRRFGGTGRAVGLFGDFGHGATSVAFLPGGQILIAGQVLQGTNPYYQTLVAAFEPNGTLAHYGPQGVAIVPIGMYSRANGLAIDATQRAVTVGFSDLGGGGSIVFALTRHL
jgi:uncharacterized delta-60 repeat protein